MSGPAKKMARRWVGGLTVFVAICVSGCAAPTTAPTPSAAATSDVAGAPARVTYVGIHWVATQVSRKGVTQPIPAAVAVTVDFLPSHSAVFSDGVNAVSARWASLSKEEMRLDEVRSSAEGYVGHDAAQLAAILAVQLLIFPAGAGGSSSQSVGAIVSRTGDTLTLAGDGVRISYRNAGATPPELTRPALSTSLAVRSSAPYDLYTHCGIREALIDSRYYLASPVLADGSGNPPAGWGNPYDSGTMTVNPDKTADFHDAAGHRAHFVLRPRATTWLQLCA